MRRKEKLDEINIELLRLLQRNARQTHRELGDAVRLAGSSVCERIKRLERSGVILGYRAIIAPSMLGADHDYLIRLQLSAAEPSSLLCFERELKTSSLILGAAKVGGPASYQIRAVSRAAVAWIEALTARCGVTTLGFEVLPVIEEIIPYRDPPLNARASIRDPTKSDPPS